MCQITVAHILKGGVEHLWEIIGGTAQYLTSRLYDRRLRTQERPAVNNCGRFFVCFLKIRC